MRCAQNEIPTTHIWYSGHFSTQVESKELVAKKLNVAEQ